MRYPEEFVNKAKRIYPNWAKLHELLDKNSPCIGPLLAEGKSLRTSFSAREILNANSLNDLQKEAHLLLERNAIYDEFVNIMGWNK